MSMMFPVISFIHKFGGPYGYLLFLVTIDLKRFMLQDFRHIHLNWETTSKFGQNKKYGKLRVAWIIEDRCTKCVIITTYYY